MRKPAGTALPNRAIFFVLLLTGGSTSVARPIPEQRQTNQQQRIEQGVQSGSLTRREANRLEAQQNRIERSETRMEADGVVKVNERKRLSARKNKASRNIYRKKHNLRNR